MGNARMIVWIWDAPGPHQTGSGVTDSEDRARQSAEAFMLKAQAPAARVEQASLDIGRGLTVGYVPTGYGWAAARTGDAVTWTPLYGSRAAS